MAGTSAAQAPQKFPSAAKQISGQRALT